MSQGALVLFTKPARPGQVKTRLVGELTPEQTAALHAAFRDDLCERLATGNFHLEVAWALADGEPLPDVPPPVGGLPAQRQIGGDLGDRLYRALAGLAEAHPQVGAVGSDHPELASTTVEDAFHHLERGAELVLGPAADGGYYLVAAQREALDPALFAGVEWSTERVLGQTLERAARLGLRVELLPEGHDIDRPDDLERLAGRLASEPDLCPRTQRLLASWGFLAIASTT